MIPVQLESPYGSTDPEVVAQNEQYLQNCICDCLDRGEAPFASHQMYTCALNDQVLAERALGIAAGFVWAALAKRRVVYLDRGLTSGMKRGIEHARSIGQPIELRYILHESVRVPHESISTNVGDTLSVSTTAFAPITKALPERESIDGTSCDP